MFCIICKNEASFICDCSSIYICTAHLGDHLRLKCGGQFNHIDESLEPQNQSFLQQKITRNIDLVIQAIKTLKTRTRRLVNLIENESNKMIQKLNQDLLLLKTFFNRTKFASSEFPQIEIFLKTKKEIIFPDFQPVEELIRNTFTQEIFKNNGEDDWQDWTLKRFLTSYHGGFWCGQIDYSRDLLICGSYDSMIRVWNLKTNSLVSAVEGHKSEVRCLTLAGTNHFLSGSNDKTIKIWEIDSGFCIGKLTGHKGCVYSIEVFDNSKKAVSCSRGKDIIVWNLQHRSLIFSLDTQHICWFVKVKKDFSHAFVSIGNTVKCLNLLNGQISGLADGFSRSVKCFDVTMDEKVMVCGNFDGSIKVFEISQVANSYELGKHKKLINSISLMRNDCNLITGSDDMKVIYWNFLNRTMIFMFDSHTSFVHVVLPYKDYCISLSEDSLILFNRLLDLKTEEKLPLKPYDSLKQFSFSTPYMFFIQKNSIKQWNSIQNEEKHILTETKEISCYSLTNCQSFIAVGLASTQENVSVWDLNTRHLVSGFKAHENTLTGIIFISNDSKFITSSVDKTIKFWNFSTFSLEKVINLEFGNLKNWISLNSRNIAIYSTGKTVCCVDINKKILGYEIFKSTNFIRFIDVTNDEKFILSSDLYTGIYVWDVIGKKIEYFFRSFGESEDFLVSYPEFRTKFNRLLFS